MRDRQHVRFCTSSDGVRLAYASVGTGPPLVNTPNWLSHLVLYGAQARGHPEAGAELLQAFDELQRHSSSAGDALRICTS